jgi:hypothetical protein
MLRRGSAVLGCAAWLACAQQQAPRTGKQNLTGIVERLEQARAACPAEAERGAPAAVWLLGRLNNTGWKVSAEYKEMLGRLYEALANADCKVIGQVAKDLEVKADDCRMAGHGRDVPVQVWVRKEGNELHGWQIFARWTDGRSFGVEKPLRLLSSPARGEMPPGEYLLQARKPGSGARSEPLRFTVGGSKVFECDIPVP